MSILFFQVSVIPFANMHMFYVETGRPIVARYVISELLHDHLDHIISVHSARSGGRAVSLTHG